MAYVRTGGTPQVEEFRPEEGGAFGLTEEQFEAWALEAVAQKLEAEELASSP